MSVEMRKLQIKPFFSSHFDKYLGKYDRVSADKYDEFLKELGVNMLLRKAATASSPVFEVGVV